MLSNRDFMVVARATSAEVLQRQRRVKRTGLLVTVVTEWNTTSQGGVELCWLHDQNTKLSVGQT